MILDKTNALQKLRISNINLNDDDIINQISKVIEVNKSSLKSLNLSNASLSPKLLHEISVVLKKQP